MAHSGSRSLYLLGVLTLGCSGTIADEDTPPVPGAGGSGSRGEPGPVGSGGPGSGGPGGTPSACGTGPAVSPGLTRLLTPIEYVNTVRDLVGEQVIDTGALPTAALFHGFDNNASSQTANESTVPQYLAAARSIANRMSTKIVPLSPCDAAAKGDETCAKEFIAGFGKRAFRRPLTTTESMNLLAVYKTARAGVDHPGALTLTLEALLGSPQFLYRFETSTTFKEGSLYRLDDYEVASRLSYLFWDRMPDAELFAAADGKQLGTVVGIAAQARRMMADPRARAAMDEFHGQWLKTDAVKGSTKDAKLFPKFNAGIASAMSDATGRFVNHVFWEEGGKLSSLFTAAYGFRNDTLATFLGAPLPGSTMMAKVALPASERAGIVTDVGLMTMLGKDNDTDVVNRGRFVFEQFLCREIPDPPAGLDTTLSTAPTTTPPTKRALFEVHKRDAICAACHNLLDPIGLAFENYDTVGKFRTMDSQGRAIDSAGDVPDEGFKPFRGAVEMAAQLPGHAGVSACVAKQWFRYAMGRHEQDADRCAIQSLAEMLGPTGPGTKDMLIALTGTAAFRYRSAE